MSHSRKRILIIFAREPELGKVKTRLLKDFSAFFVTRLYKAFLKDIIPMTRQAACEERFIYFTGRLPLRFLSKFEKGFKLKRQHGQDLGKRMLNAAREVCAEAPGQVVLVGTDCLEVNPKIINLAFKKLISHDIVVGPTWDGGYYLIGLNKPDSRFFSGIAWGTEKVFQQTLKKIKLSKNRFFQLKTLQDIDTVSDIHTWLKSNQRNPLTHTARLLQDKILV